MLKSTAQENQIAYFSMEIALAVESPTYSVAKKLITAVIVSGAIGVLPLMAQEKPPREFEN